MFNYKKIASVAFAMLAFSAAPLAHAAVTVIGSDVTTQGSWNGKYGQDGFMIANGPSNVPSYATATVSGATTFTWAGLTSDVRALQSGAGSSTRMASTYSNNNFNVNVSVNDGASHAVSLYFLDWDTTSRAETVTVLDADTNAVLDTENLTSFYGGKYLSWNVSGNVKINISTVGGSNAAVLSGVFFGVTSGGVTPPSGGGGGASSASLIGSDTTTQGSWKGKYGTDGYYIATGTSQNPSYGSAAVAGAATFTWANNTPDPRALQNFDAILGNITTAATYYANSFDINVGIKDGNSHQVSLYLLDWDHTNSTQTVNIYDAVTGGLLDTEALSGYGDGKYYSWNIKGNVRINLSAVGYNSAVVSGIFFGAGGTVSTTPPSSGTSVTPIGADTTTQGSWKGKYGSEGYYIAKGISQDPSYGSANVNGAATFTWGYNIPDARALQNFDAILGNIHTAATYYANNFNINVNINDANSHQVSLYLLDWDHTNLTETINVYDAVTGGLLDSQTITDFGNGKYFSWNIKGNVRINLSTTGYNNALVSGIFFGTGGTVSAPPTNTGSSRATFVGSDTATEGTWTGKYGAAGYMMANGPTVAPSYASASVRLNPFNFTYTSLTTDPRALQLSAGSNDRMAAIYGTYKVSYFEFPVTINDGGAHNISMYLLDWDSTNRPETISVVDPSSGVVLDSQTVVSYHNGIWLTWSIQGNVVFRVTPIGEIYAAASGLFFN